MEKIGTELVSVARPWPGADNDSDPTKKTTAEMQQPSLNAIDETVKVVSEHVIKS